MSIRDYISWHCRSEDKAKNLRSLYCYLNIGYLVKTVGAFYWLVYRIKGGPLMMAHMFGPISEGRNKVYLTDTLTIVNWFSSLMLRVLHLPCYFPPARRRLHSPVGRRLRLRGPIDGRPFSPSFVSNGHFNKNFKGRTQ